MIPFYLDTLLKKWLESFCVVKVFINVDVQFGKWEHSFCSMLNIIWCFKCRKLSSSWRPKYTELLQIRHHLKLSIRKMGNMKLMNTSKRFHFQQLGIRISVVKAEIKSHFPRLHLIALTMRLSDVIMKRISSADESLDLRAGCPQGFYVASENLVSWHSCCCP